MFLLSISFDLRIIVLFLRLSFGNTRIVTDDTFDRMNTEGFFQEHIHTTKIKKKTTEQTLLELKLTNITKMHSQILFLANKIFFNIYVFHLINQCKENCSKRWSKTFYALTIIRKYNDGKIKYVCTCTRCKLQIDM